MKRLAAILLAAVMLLTLAACSKHMVDDHAGEASLSDMIAADEDPTRVPLEVPGLDDEPEESGEEAMAYPAGISVLGISLEGMTPEEAAEAMKAAAENYEICVKIAGREFMLSAAQLGLTLNGADDLPGPSVLSDNPSALNGIQVAVDSEAVQAALEKLVSDHFSGGEVVINYDSQQKCFVTKTDEAAAPELPETCTADVVSAAQQLLAECEITIPEIDTNSLDAAAAVAEANEVLNLQLQITFAPAQGNGGTATPSRDTLAGFYSISEDGRSIELDEAKVYSYVEQLSIKYSVAGTYTKFISHSGAEINFNIPHGGCEVDATALYDRLLKQLTECKSADWKAAYSTNSSGSSTLAYNGNYIEVDLSSQCLWMYRNGEVILTTAIVSGDVAKGCATPNGNYTIYHTTRGQTLTGPGYADYTNYFMIYSGNYGIHDATWRSSFGGSNYLYDGSHGCINVPLSAAQTIYNNLTMGMHVLIYGGARSVEDRVQTLTGTTLYQVTAADGNFKLDAAPAYSTELSYISSNNGVVTVSADGTVTIVGEGTAVITVAAAEKTGLTSAEMKVTVKVGTETGGEAGGETGGETGGDTDNICASEGHFWIGEDKTEATCTREGVQKYYCAVCGEEKSETIVQALGHSWGEWSVTKEATTETEGTKTRTCGTCGEIDTAVISKLAGESGGAGVEPAE